MAIKIGDKVFVEGVVHSLSENSSDVEVETCLGDVDYYPADKVRSDDKQIVVPDFVKRELDGAFKDELTSLEITKKYWWTDGSTFSKETSWWIADHHTAFMYALVYGYKAELVKKCNVVAWKDPKGIHATRYWYRLSNGTLAITGKDGNRDSNQQWTLNQIKEYGLENFERVEVKN